MERFGYPKHVLTSAARLIADQYVDCPQLRPILATIVKAAEACGPVVMQARKTFAALATKTANVCSSTADNADARGFRSSSRWSASRGRLRSNAHDTMSIRIGLTALRDVEAEVIAWIRRAYTRTHDLSAARMKRRLSCSRT
jgi:hypothetical protein